MDRPEHARQALAHKTDHRSRGGRAIRSATIGKLAFPAKVKFAIYRRVSLSNGFLTADSKHDERPEDISVQHITGQPINDRRLCKQILRSHGDGSGWIIFGQ